VTGQETASSRRQHFVLAVLAAAATLLFCLPVLDPDVQLFYRDTGRLYYPLRWAIAQRLRALELPLLDPWTESGVSLMGQLTPGLFHPATLLYVVLPFDLAFKLHHLLALPVAGLGAWLLARRLGAGPWAAAVAGITYGGCGYVVSMVSSNLPFAWGAAAMPLAIDGFLAVLERFSFARLAWAALALALCGLAGDAQAMEVAGVIGTAWALARALLGAGPASVATRLRGALRAGLLATAWGAAALALASPALLPAAARLGVSTRSGGQTEPERHRFAVHPARLAGVLVPRAFDDGRPDPEDKGPPAGHFTEYFSTGFAAFADSIFIGSPALLLAAAAAFAGRRGRFLLLGGMILLAASTGEALGTRKFLDALVPGLFIFRYSEKFVGAASLLLCVAAALGTERLVRGGTRGALAMAIGAATLSASLWAVGLACARKPPGWIDFLVEQGKYHRTPTAHAFLDAVHAGATVAAGLSLAVALVAILVALRPRLGAPAAAACCTAAVFAVTSAHLMVAPVSLSRGPFPLAERLVARAGPSPGQWRIFTVISDLPYLRELDDRAGPMAAVAHLLGPHFNTLASIEGAHEYFSAGDAHYAWAWRKAPYAMTRLFGVRFTVLVGMAVSPREAARLGMFDGPIGSFVLENRVLPRAFVVHRTRPAGAEEAFERMGKQEFDPGREAFVRPGGLALDGAPHPGDRVRWSRPRPEEYRLVAEVGAPGLLVVGEHFDQGWSALVDGRPAPVLRANVVAMGVALPPGRHEVRLVFRPRGLGAGVGAAAAAVGTLGLGLVLETRRRRRTSPD